MKFLANTKILTKFLTKFDFINIRHNNKAKNKLKMTDKKLEIWYDETYQLALLAILLIDNIERSKKIKELKKTLHNPSK